MIDEIINDEVMRDVLSALYYLNEATPFEISKVTGHSSATVTRKLQKLVEWGIIPPPIEDTSTGRLRRIYKRPDDEFYKYFKHFLYQIYKENESEFHNFMINKMYQIFNIPYQWERDLYDALESSKSPTIILIGQIIGYWDVEDNKLKVTPHAIEHLKHLYKEYIRYYIEALALIDEEETLNFLITLLEKKFGVEIPRDLLAKVKK